MRGNLLPAKDVSHVNERQEGFLLLEVMVAVVVLAVMTVSLAGAAQSVSAAAGRLRGGQVEPSRGFAQDDTSEAAVGKAWRWGEQVEAVLWGRSGKIEVKVSDCLGLHISHRVGVWIDGWFVGEFETDSDGTVLLSSGNWVSKQTVAAAPQRELIVRVRTTGECWGPPWRLVLAGANSDAGQFSLERAQKPDEDCAVVHLPFLSTATLRLGGVSGAASSECGGLLRVVCSSGEGVVEVGLEGRSQSWSAEAGRSVDVYF